MADARPARMHLGVFFNHTGHHIASWRHPKADADANINIDHYLRLAQTAEAAGLDFLFFADSAATAERRPESLRRSAQYTAYFEPTTLLAAMAMVTRRIGLVATATTSYNEPYNVARRFASLDHISKGRAGWNVVTSGNEAEAWNFGREEHFAHDSRYDRAHEFVQVVHGLWDSWDDDAFPRDKASGVYLEPARMHHLDHHGKHFKVRGPLNVPRCPQGYPVIFQAGTSEAGRELAAETAEGVFTSNLTAATQKEHYDDVKGRMARFGRTPDEMKILPGLTAVVAATRQEAHDKWDHLQSLIHPQVGLDYLSMLLSTNLTEMGLEPDDTFPVLEMHDKVQSQGMFRNIMATAAREKLTVRQMWERLAGSRGKATMIGSVKDVADEMQQWFEAGACDGFILQPSYLPGELDEVCQMLVPELQRRGLLRVGYEGTMLRDHMGLKRPPSRYVRST
jgi:FMN-dependent oxidoreductase (nitrilotriacetate monooxygenase family)